MSTPTIAAIRDQIRNANDERRAAEVALRDTETQLRQALGDLNNAQLEVGRRADLAEAGDAMAALDAAERRVRALRLMSDARKAVIADADARLHALDNDLSNAIGTADRLRLKAGEARAKAADMRRELARLDGERERFEAGLVEAQRHVALFTRQLAEFTGETAGEPDTTTTQAATPAAA